MTLFDMLELAQIDSIMDSYNSLMQSDAEDVEYEDVSESECEMIETSKDE